MTFRKSTILCCILICVLCTLSLYGSADSGKANWELLKKWSPGKVFKKISSSLINPRWIDNSSLFWYIHSSPEQHLYWLVNPEKKSRTELFDKKKLASKLSRMSGLPVDHLKLYFPNMGVSDGGNILTFDYRQYSYRYEIGRGHLTREPKGKNNPVSYLNLSPDRRFGIYQQGNNLYLSRMDRKKDVKPQSLADSALSMDGQLGYSWGTDGELINNACKKKKRIDGIWSPDSKKFAILRRDVRKLPDLWLINHLHKPNPVLKTYKTSYPGSRVSQWELWVFDIEKGQKWRVPVERWVDQTLEELFFRGQWWNDSSDSLYFIRRHRNYQQVDLCAFRLNSGKVRVMVEERMTGQVYVKPLVLLPKKMGLLWWSQQSGHGHFKLFDLNGRYVKSLTNGAYNSDRFVAYNATENTAFIVCNGKREGINPYYKMLYRVDLESGRLTCLTPENANHRIFLSPDKHYIVDNYSRPDMPAQTVLRDSSGKRLMELNRVDMSGFMKAGWRAPEVFTCKAADGITDMWGIMYKPFDFDPKRKYPVITRVYPGRQDEFIPWNFSPVSFDATLAQLGFIVLRFGNRGGCFERGVKYREYGREQFRDYGLADKKAVIEAMAKRYKYLDLNRVGIFGSSSGGFMTVSAMLQYPDFFKVGVASAAPNDPSAYFHIWVERYKGVDAVRDKKGTITAWKSQAEGNLEIASKLKGHLLMINGAQDDNVHVTHLYRMADRFIKAGKRFDMFVVPGAGHGVGGWRMQYSLVSDYFARHLLKSDRSGATLLFRK